MAEERHETLGTCCICEAPGATVIVMLNARSPLPGKGWGCFQCGIAQNGAHAVICEACARQAERDPTPQAAVEAALRFVCRGFPGSDGRMRIEDLRGEHGHDRTKHPEVEQVPALQVLPGDTRFGNHADEGQGCVCSRCGQTIWEGVVAIRAWPAHGEWEVRYHPTCMGAVPTEEDPYVEDDGWDMGDFPPFDLGIEEGDDTPCAFCGKAGCEGTCTGAILARDASREDTP